MLAGAVRDSSRNWRFTPNLPPKRNVPGASAAKVCSLHRLAVRTAEQPPLLASPYWRVPPLLAAFALPVEAFLLNIPNKLIILFALLD